MARTYHTSRQHHRRKRPNLQCIQQPQQPQPQQQQQQQQQYLRQSNFYWINNLAVVFICSLLFLHCSKTTSAEVRIAYSIITIHIPN